MTPIQNAMPDLDRDLRFRPAAVETPERLTREQVDCYNERGYVSPIDVFSESEALANRAYFDDLMGRASKEGWGSYSINGWHLNCGGIYDLVVAPRILDAVQDLLGPDLVCWGTHYFAKMPDDGKRVSWHQDASYWPLTPSRTVTVWLAIDDADEENGAMQVVPGSHRLGQIAFEESAPEENNVLNQTVHDPSRFGGEPVTLSMRAGQMSLHSDLLLHGSAPNRSTRRRCGLTMRFVPPEVKAYRGWNGRSILCRGNDPSGHWYRGARPDGDTIPKR
ncbi:phytanoyl-CoA dioxygenase family protein [Candidatus Poribacteria bacterium]|nr:phytanoyl-CoA dioxygenase family protein [Candidatus Poribacteria bacterium]